MVSYDKARRKAVLLVLLGITGAAALDNGLGLRPPMGYNSWNHLMCGDGMNEAAIKSVADAIVSKGLKAVGYEYVNLDDCWLASERDSKGRLQAHATKFPSGMKALGDYIHSKGLKFGIYTDRGTKTCAGVGPGVQGNEYLDAQTFADWGVDYVKEDNCYNGALIPGIPDDIDKAFRQFALFRDALNATGRPIFFSVCGGGWRLPLISDLTYYASDPRGGQALGNAWRTSADCIGWETCQHALFSDAALSQYAGEGGFNDPDMLLGSRKSAAAYLSKEQSRTQFNLWSILMAPLLIGAPINDWGEGDYDLSTYLNAEVIAVNQDSLLRQGFVAHEEKSVVGIGRTQVWARELSGGSFALVYLNTYPWSSTVKCDADCWAKLNDGMQITVAKGTTFSVRDLWMNSSAEVATAQVGEDYAVKLGASGESKMFKLSPQPFEIIM